MQLIHNLSVRFVIAIALTALVLTATSDMSVKAQRLVSQDHGAFMDSTGHGGGVTISPGESYTSYIHECVFEGYPCLDWDGFLIYFGDHPRWDITKQYTITVTGEIENPEIKVETYDDYQYQYYYRMIEAAGNPNWLSEMGLHQRTFPLDAVQPGTLIAANDWGTRSLTFRPLENDPGAYVISLASDEPENTGQYTISISSGE